MKRFLRFLMVLTMLVLCAIPFIQSSPAHADQVTLSWDPVTNVGGYAMFRREKDSQYDYLTFIWAGTETTYQDSVFGVDNTETTFYYVVRAFTCEEVGSTYPCTIKDWSVDSNEVSFILDRIPPEGISDLAGVYDTNTKSVRLTWTDPDRAETEWWTLYTGPSSEGPWEEIATIQDTGSNALTTSYNLPVAPNTVETHYFMIISYETPTVFTVGSVAGVLIDNRVPPGPVTLEIKTIIRE